MIHCGIALAAQSNDAQPCRSANSANAGGPFFPQFSLPSEDGKPAQPTNSVHTFTSRGCSGAVLQGERVTARVQGDTVELKDGAVYVNGVSYGAVTPSQTVEYDVTRDGHALLVDGKIRSPSH
jgi:hypothetical protein